MEIHNMRERIVANDASGQRGHSIVRAEGAGAANALVTPALNRARRRAVDHALLLRQHAEQKMSAPE